MSRTENIVLVHPNRANPSEPASVGEPGLATLAGASGAFALANFRYWRTVAPVVRGQLSRWKERAGTIPDPVLRAMASSKLRNEHFNALLAATLATLAPRSKRGRVVEAIVALQVLYDYIDVLSEQSHLHPEASAQLFTALTDAAASSPQGGDYYRDCPHSEDGGYVQALLETVRGTLTLLPCADAVAEVAREAAQRCGEAQILHHGASALGIDELRDWATLRASGTGLRWQEFVAGASASVLAIHALIVAAADPATTLQDAAGLDQLYLSIGALTMLDSLVDLDEDIAAGHLGYVQYYDHPELMAARLQSIARDAVAGARSLPNGSHHIVTLTGIVAYYASAPSANSEFARPLIAPVRRELAPLITPTLALMRAWRVAKRVRR